MKGRPLRHVLALGAWSAATLWWLWPVLSNLTQAIPGSGPGDNLTFVWNVWWMRQAVQHSGYSFFTCPLIFHPEGINLTLHTHTALPAFLAAVVAPTANLLATQNILILASLLLNGAAAYALAFHVTRHAGGALLAAMVFGWSPYIAGHLQGHFNLIAAWPLPLVTLLTLRALSPSSSFSRATVGLSSGLGAVLAATAYMDYYYAVYGLLATVVLALAHGVDIQWRTPPRSHPLLDRLGRILLWLIVIAVGVAITIGLTGGGVLSLGGLRASLTGVDNPLGVAWTLLLLWAAIQLVPQVTLTVDPGRLRTSGRVVAIALAIVAVAVTPLLAGLWDLWRHGDYVTQRYLWRSAPRGIDLATLMLGNPFGMLAGAAATAAYARLGIEPIEQTAWLGPGVMCLCAIAIVRRQAHVELRLLLCLGGVFLIWALGPYFALFGHGTAMVLPVIVVRYVPLISNARIPGRAIVMVYMVAAVLCAHAVAYLADSSTRRRRWAAALLAGLAIADYAPGALAHYRPGHPSVYDALGPSSAPGAVLELPLGLRDGFGETGRLDSSVLYYQSFHAHPVLGGFVARLPPSVRRAYETQPVLARLLRLSGGDALDREGNAGGSDAAELIRLGVRYVVLDRKAAPPPLVSYVAGLPLRLLADDGTRAVYAVGESATERLAGRVERP